MSICRGIAGRRGKNPVGIFIHNDAGGNSLNAAYWANSLANGRSEEHTSELQSRDTISYAVGRQRMTQTVLGIAEIQTAI